MGERHPPSGRDALQPHIVWTVVRKMIDVADYLDAGRLEYRWELEAEIAVSKDNDTQAARS
jgi:hypothetical protein